MKDLIERLRAFEGSDELGNGDFSLLTEAADALAQQPAGSAPVGVDGMMQLAREWCLAWGEWAHDADPGCAKESAAEAALRAALTQALAQQPAACPKCGGTGEADSGGIMPWGAPAMIPCDCQHPAAVDAHELWAAAQLAPGEGIEDGVSRIESILHHAAL